MASELLHYGAWAVDRRKMRAISPAIATLILIAIALVAGLLIFTMMGGFLRTGSGAQLSVVGTGSGSADGAKATVTLSVSNNGRGTARIAEIYVVPKTAGVSVNTVNSPDANAYGVTVAAATDASGISPATTVPAQGLDLAGGAQKTIVLELQGSGLYSGVEVTVYIVYYDLASQKGSVVTTDVLLG
jgi:flagellin-like protein